MSDLIVTIPDPPADASERQLLDLGAVIGAIHGFSSAGIGPREERVQCIVRAYMNLYYGGGPEASS